MHKSTITISTLMIASLIMLLPFASTNIYTNPAMAQGYDDEYSYYVDNSYYSTYPVEDKNYEWRKGSFEGFFVGSVEFCKHVKFDDNKKDRDGQPGPPGPAGVAGPQGERGLIGATGATGPASTIPGPQGIQGIQGERGFNGTNGVNGTQGPAGPNEINSSKLYFVTGTPATFGSGIRIPITSTAMCNTSDIVLEGGFSISTDPGADIDLTSLSAGPTNNGQDYFITAAGNRITIQSNAICFDNP